MHFMDVMEQNNKYVNNKYVSDILKRVICNFDGGQS